MRKLNPITTITVSLSICALTMIIIIFYYENRLATTSSEHYWNSAPDDVYKMMVYLDQVKTNEVWFPLCPTAPGPLHGGWSVAEGVTFPVTGEYVFELKSNMLVWAVLVRGWDSIEGEWVE